MKYAKVTMLAASILFILALKPALSSDLQVKRPIKRLDRFYPVISSREVLKSKNHLLQSPGTVLDSTYYDWQRNGGLDDHIDMFDEDGAGKVNAVWMVSYREDMSDRCMNYYFWNGAMWDDPPGGMCIFPDRSGFGSMSQLADGSLVACGHMDPDGLGIRAFSAIDSFPGQRAFSYHGTSPDTLGIWPRITANSDGSIVITGTDQLTYDVSWAKAPDRYSDFGPWTNLRLIAPDWMDGDMEWPTIDSGTNGRVGIVIPDYAGSVRYFHSTDAGDSFTPYTVAPADTAGLPSGMDSTAARLGWINSDIMFIGQEPHVVWSAGQGINLGGSYGIIDYKATIFHWSPSTGIDTVVVAWTQSVDETRNDYVPTPYNHLSVDWPSIGLASDGHTLVVAFTAFNTEDIDESAIPPTGYVDIWITSSQDNGNTWSKPVNITNPDGTVLGWDDRYPSIAKASMETGADHGKDVYMVYQSDDLAGTHVQGTEGGTNMDYVKFVGFYLDALSEDLVLTDPDPGIAGITNTFTVRNATPGEWVKYLYGFTGGSTGQSDCLGVTVDIEDPLGMGSAIADSDGNASIAVFVPNGASGQTVLFQACEISNCRTSNLVEYTFP
jgi:hypothetical protein